ncbi:hypothetical protein J6590_044999 [Homalodisca vitripennis]|nr:hypothetical protein J6590_044999 [Homalodisca vitripennis]
MGSLAQPKADVDVHEIESRDIEYELNAEIQLFLKFPHFTRPRQRLNKFDIIQGGPQKQCPGRGVESSVTGPRPAPNCSLDVSNSRVFPQGRLPARGSGERIRANVSLFGADAFEIVVQGNVFRSFIKILCTELTSSPKLTFAKALVDMTGTVFCPGHYKRSIRFALRQSGRRQNASYRRAAPYLQRQRKIKVKAGGNLFIIPVQLSKSISQGK